MSVNRVVYSAHRLVWAIVNGEDPPYQVDHIHGVEAGNHIENLRLVPKGALDNGQNKKKHKNNTSGYTGVSWDKQANKWRASICKNRKAMHIGLFENPEDAYKAYVAAKEKLHTFNPTVRDMK